jgi:hypothetical protein
VETNEARQISKRVTETHLSISGDSSGPMLLQVARHALVMTSLYRSWANEKWWSYTGKGILSGLAFVATSFSYVLREEKAMKQAR